MEKTLEQYDLIITRCKDIFSKKMKDYGTAWRVLRASSITDQLYIKAKRISTIEEAGESKVDEGVVSEYIAIVNYCAMGLVQLELGPSDSNDLLEVQVLAYYSQHIETARSLMINKNSDYGEAWREMRVSSITDLILMKLHRTKQIEDNKGATLISEGIDANYHDMMNYAIFAMILLDEKGIN
ncbi:MAG: hypothetical protein ACJA2N_000779 [Salibacteraceae bacterium]|jgi:hypothetical protein